MAYTIKQIPEDFFVKEMPSYELDENGRYCYFILEKRDYDTMKAVELIANWLKIPVKWIGFAGTKDKIAVTQQVCSAYGTSKEALERIKYKDIRITYLGKGKKPVSLGDLYGNSFIIVVRNLSKIVKLKEFYARQIQNYFGEQRFSESNVEIGRSIIKRNFQKAVEMISQKEVRYYLEDNPGNFAGALRQIPLKIRKMYVHAYQSYIWNIAAKERMKTNMTTNEKIPIIGFGTELKDDAVGKIIRKIMFDEKITTRDFVIQQIPELSSEGAERDLFVMPQDFSASEPEEDELNEGKYKITLQFTLPKGCYATVVIEQMFSYL